MKLVYKILDLLHQNEDGIEYVKILNSPLGVERYEILEALANMKNEGLISGNLQSGELVHLTSKGKISITSHQEDLEDKVNQRKQYIEDRRCDRRFHIIFSIISGVVIAVITALAEYFIPILFG